MGRDRDDEVRSAARLVLAVQYIQRIINAMPVPVAILNEKSQVIVANRSWERLAGKDSECLIGKRHGEQFGCLGLNEGPDGCGSSEACSECGAAVGIMQSQVTGEQVKLIQTYNPAAAEGVMCRTTLSVDWTGRLFDCDFNQMLSVPVAAGLPQNIRDFDPVPFSQRAIAIGQHCFGCTAGAGSGCQGAIRADV